MSSIASIILDNLPRSSKLAKRKLLSKYVQMMFPDDKSVTKSSISLLNEYCTRLGLRLRASHLEGIGAAVRFRKAQQAQRACLSSNQTKPAKRPKITSHTPLTTTPLPPADLCDSALSQGPMTRHATKRATHTPASPVTADTEPLQSS